MSAEEEPNRDEDAAAAMPAQFMVGAAFGGLGGYMDSLYIEPFGLFFGGTLAVIQALDYNGVIKAPWNPTRQASDLSGFIGDNMPVVGGFASGYFVGFNILDWLPESGGAVEEGAGEQSSSSSSE